MAVFIFGGAAVHIYTRSRVSGDLDAEVASTAIRREDLQTILRQLPIIDYETPDAGPLSLEYDTTFNPTLGPLHEDYQEAAMPLDISDSSVLAVYVVSPEDLATSKLGRLSDIDIEDILALLACQSMTWASFESRAAGAIDYAVGNRADLISKLQYVKTQAKKRGLV